MPQLFDRLRRWWARRHRPAATPAPAPRRKGGGDYRTRITNVFVDVHGSLQTITFPPGLEISSGDELTVEVQGDRAAARVKGRVFLSQEPAAPSQPVTRETSVPKQLFHVTVPVACARGHQVLAVMAQSEADAIARIRAGEGDFVCEELEITELEYSGATAQQQRCHTVTASYPLDLDQMAALDRRLEDAAGCAASHTGSGACRHGGESLECDPRRELIWEVPHFPTARQLLDKLVGCSGDVPGLMVTFEEG